MEKFGRPTKYTEQAVVIAKSYLESCKDTEEQVIAGQGENFVNYRTKLNVNIPTIEGLALELDVHKDTIYEWEKIHQDFSDVVTRIRNTQAVRLVNMGLSGQYNHTVAKVLLSKHGYSEKHEQDISVTENQVIKPPAPQKSE